MKKEKEKKTSNIYNPANKNTFLHRVNWLNHTRPSLGKKIKILIYQNTLNNTKNDHT